MENIPALANQAERSAVGGNSKKLGGPKTEKEGVVLEHVEAQVEVLPIKVYSEKDLVNELSAIQAALENPNPDEWQSRMEALQRLQQLAVGGAAVFEQFVQALKGMQDAIAAQISDPRSLLSREACATVSILAQVLTDSFAPLADLWTSVLLRLSMSKIQIMALAADLCLRCIVSCTSKGFNRLLLSLTESSKHKNSTIRLRSICYISLALWCWDEGCLERTVDNMAKAIQGVLTDADSVVRSTGRQAYWMFHGKFPVEAQKLLKDLDPTIQKHIFWEEKNAGPAFAQSLVPKLRYKLKSPADDGAQNRNTTPAANNATSAPANEATRYQDGQSTLPSRSSRRQTLGPIRLMRDISLGDEGGGILENQEQSIPTANRAPLRMLAPTTNTTMASSQSNNNPGTQGRSGGMAGPQRVARAATPTRINRGQSTGYQDTGGDGEAGKVRGAVRVHSGALSTGIQRSGSGTDVVFSGMGSFSVGASSTNEEVQEITQPAASAIRVPKAEAMAMAQAQDGQEYFQGVGMAEYSSAYDRLLRDMEDKLWSTRLQAFEETRDKIHSASGADGERMSVPNSHLPRLLHLITDHINDNHYKVSQAVLETVLALMRSQAPALASSLNLLFPEIFSKLKDPRERTKFLATEVLTASREAFDPNVLVAAVIRVLADQPEKVKIGMLEYLACIIPRSSEYLNHPAHLRIFLQKLGGFVLNKGGNSELPKAVTNILTALYHLDNRVFIEQFSTLGNDYRITLKKLITPVISDFEARLNAHGHCRSTEVQPGRKAKALSKGPGGVEKEVIDPQAREGGIKSDLTNDVFLQRPVTSSPVAERQVQTPPVPRQPLPSVKTPLQPSALDFVPYQIAEEPLDDYQVIQKALLTIGDVDSDPEHVALAVQQLIGISNSQDSGLWHRCFGQVIHVVLEKLRADKLEEKEAQLEEATVLFNNHYIFLQCIGALVKNQEVHFGLFLEVTVQRLLESLVVSYNIGCLAEKILKSLAESSDSARFLEVLWPHLTNLKTPERCLLVLLRLVAAMIPKLNSKVLLNTWPKLIPVLTTTYDSQSSAVRHATVCTLTEVYFILGDVMLPNLQHLKPVQLKLLTLYITTQQNKGRSGIARGR